jgi:two-component system, OmpR family, sensor kinase
MTLSLRARLTVWYTFALLIVMVVGGTVVLWQQGRIGLRRVDRGLADLTTTIVNLVGDELNEDPVLISAARKVQDTVAAPGRAVAILDSQGQPLAAAWNGLSLQPPLPDFQSGLRVWTAETSAGAWRVRAQPAAFGIQRVVVVDATPLSDVLRERREVQEAMWVGIPGILVLAAAGGLWLASIGLRPITAMAERAANMPLSGIQDLGEFERTDELGQLARAFNGLVARLRAALHTQRQFMADASHELRTPVSVIRSAADITLSRRQRDEAEYREALTMVGGEARRLSRLVEDMLVLARADAGGYPLQRVTLYLDELVADCRPTVGVLAVERGVVLRFLPMPEIPLVGDEDLLRRMLLNVVQNAVQHTASGGSVTVEVLSTEPSVTIDVTDEGSGIPPADWLRIFDRFVQLDSARRGSGAGLGLPIAQWIAKAHGGSLELLASSTGGSTFRLVLPKPASTSRVADAVNV